jgi:hypothetical protein
VVSTQRGMWGEGVIARIAAQPAFGAVRVVRPCHQDVVTVPGLDPGNRSAPAVEERRLRGRLANIRAEVALGVAERHAEMEADIVRDVELPVEAIHDGRVKRRRHRADPDRARCEHQVLHGRNDGVGRPIVQRQREDDAGYARHRVCQPGRGVKATRQVFALPEPSSWRFAHHASR